MTEGAVGQGRAERRVRTYRETLSQMRIELAVLTVRFDLFIEGAFSPEDREKLEAKIMASVVEQMNSANAQQSRDILNEMHNLFNAYKTAQTNAQLESQTALLGAIQQRKSRWLWWALGIVAGIIVAVISTAFGVWLAGVLEQRS